VNTHTDLAQRLLALEALNILDTPNEKAYDDLVSLAAELCEVPISLISLVDEKRQWFKAKFGLEVTETPREHAFCAHAILRDEMTIVEDSHLDDRFCSNPLVLQTPFIRFYAGAPLIVHDGHRIGTLCVIDVKPKKLTEFQQKALQVLSRHAVTLMESRHRESLRFEALKIIEDQKLQIISGSKLSALGEMAAGVAHEINNPLAAIMAYAGELLYRVKLGECPLETVEKSAKSIERTSLRIAKIVRALRSFARDGEQDPPERISLSTLFNDALELSRERFRNNNVQLEVAIPDASITLVCKPVPINQVILNLINNAFDAVQSLPEKWIKLDFAVTDAFTEIAIIDSGTGIPPQIQHNLMKPFFTTKPAGKGTGLGLSISQRILEGHGGSLTYDSTSAHTRFVIRLPHVHP